MAKLVDAPGLGPDAGNSVGVRVPPRAPRHRSRFLFKEAAFLLPAMLSTIVRHTPLELFDCADQKKGLVLQRGPERIPEPDGYERTRGDNLKMDTLVDSWASIMSGFSLDGILLRITA